MPRQRSEQRPGNGAAARRGVIAIETLAVMPILIIFMVGIIEYGSTFRLDKQVAAASRFGARLAAEMPRAGAVQLGNFNQADTPNNLKSRIDQFFATQGLRAVSEVVLEHNACGVANPWQELSNLAGRPGKDDAMPALPPLPGGGPPGNLAFVRVTVTVLVADHAPNSLRTLGLDWGRTRLTHSTVFRLEANNQPPVAGIGVPPQALPNGVTADWNAAAGAAGTLRIQANRRGEVTLRLNASRSSDAEESGSRLAKRWQTNGAPIGSAQGAGFQVRLPIPEEIGTARYEVQLEVRDSCGCNQSQTLPIEVARDR